MTTFINRLSHIWLSLNATRRRRPALYRLDALNLSDHDLADLNLPPAERARLEVDRMRDRQAGRFNFP